MDHRNVCNAVVSFLLTGHGQGSAQRMTVFLELVDLASTRKMPSPELPLVVQGAFNIDQHRSAAAMMVSSGHNNVIKNSHAFSHNFNIGDLCGCRDTLLLQVQASLSLWDCNIFVVQAFCICFC